VGLGAGDGVSRRGKAVVRLDSGLD
jgi:hypothetical protein